MNPEGLSLDQVMCTVEFMAKFHAIGSALLITKENIHNRLLWIFQGSELQKHETMNQQYPPPSLVIFFDSLIYKNYYIIITLLRKLEIMSLCCFVRANY